MTGWTRVIFSITFFVLMWPGIALSEVPILQEPEYVSKKPLYFRIELGGDSTTTIWASLDDTD